MANLNRLSDISFSANTTKVSVRSFSNLMVIGETNAFTERVISVSDISDLESKGVTSGPLYILVRDALAQHNTYSGITTVYVGRKVPTTTVQTPSKDKDGKDTTTSQTTSETWVEAIRACRKSFGDFFGLTVQETNADELIAIARYCESAGILFGCASADSNVINAEVTSCTLSRLNQLNLNNTFYVYDAYATEQSIPAAWMARKFAELPGSENWANTRLAGVKATELDEVASQTVKKKGGNTFEQFPDFALTQYGQVVGKEYIDIVRGIYALKADLQAEVSLLVVDKRLPYDDESIQRVYMTCVKVMEKYQGRNYQFIDGDIFDTDGNKHVGFRVTVPRAIDISSNKRASRELDEVVIEGRIKGSINKITVRGTASYSTDI